MQSETNFADDEWPTEMVITVDERPTMLLELLWAREAYNLHPREDHLPPALEVPADASISLDTPTRSAWERSWAEAWRAAVAHVGTEPDKPAYANLADSAPGSAEREEFLERITGVEWRTSFGSDQPDLSEMPRWLERVGPVVVPTSIDDSPERRDQRALVGAWQEGLRKVVVVPCAGLFSRKISPDALLVSAHTRNDSASYRSALGDFRQPSHLTPKE